MDNDKILQLLGALVPYIFGGNVQDFMQKMLGSSMGGAYNDSLLALSGQYSAIGNKAYGVMPNAQVMSNAIDKRLGNIGIDPTTERGQALNGVLLSIAQSGFFPGMTENILGIPNAGQMMQMARIGAVGINAASGNRYSFFDENRFLGGMDVAMSRMRKMYDFAAPDGTEDMGYTHGLNGREMGIVNQRILSSSLAYKDDNGNEYDETSREFTENLKGLGEKFNGVASMLNKITGSIEETMSLLDSLGGGNFLGGSRAHAEKVAERAKTMATAIRTSAAEAGITPQEMYRDMSRTRAGLAAGMGLGREQLDAGAGSMFDYASAQAQASYANWLKDHPKASISERNRAKIGITNSVVSYHKSGAGKMAGLVAENMDMFNPEDLDFIKDAYASGRAKDAQDRVMEVVGSQKFHEFMKSPARQLAAREEINRLGGERQDLLNDLDRTGAATAAAEASNMSARREMRSGIRYAMSELSRNSGNNTARSRQLRDSNNQIEFNALKAEAEKLGIKDVGRYSPKNVDAFRRHVMKMAGIAGVDVSEVERSVDSALIEAQEAMIDKETMSDEDIADAGNEIRAMLDKGGLGGQILMGIEKRISNGDLEGAVDALAEARGLKPGETREFRNKILKGKLSKNKAKNIKSRFGRSKQQLSGELTDKEKEEIRNEKIAERQRGYRKSLDKYVDELSGSSFVSAVSSMTKGNELQAATNGQSVDEAGELAASETLSGMLEGSIGDVSGDRFKGLSKELGKEVYGALKEGRHNTFEEAFLSTVYSRRDDLIGEGKAFKSDKEFDDFIGYYGSVGKNDLERANKNFNINLSRKFKLGTGIGDVGEATDEEKKRKISQRSDRYLSEVAQGSAKSAYNAGSSAVASTSAKENIFTKDNKEGAEILLGRDDAYAEKNGNVFDKFGDNSTAVKSMMSAKKRIDELRAAVRDSELSKDDIALLSKDKEGSSEAYKKIEARIGQGAKETLAAIRGVGAVDVLGMTDEEYSKSGRERRVTEGVAKYIGQNSAESDALAEILKVLKDIIDFFTKGELAQKLGSIVIKTKQAVD